MKANFNFEGKKGVIDYEPTPTLTKREQFAMAAMQGMLSSNHVSHNIGGVVELSVAHADALIKELAG